METVTALINYVDRTATVSEIDPPAPEATARPRRRRELCSGNKERRIR
jgi:hypothetical protein